MMLGVDPDKNSSTLLPTFVTATGIYCCLGLNVTWNSNSNAGYYKRATAIGLQQTVGNSAGMMAGQIYRITNSGGRYVMGLAVSLAAIACASVGYAAIFVCLKGLNKRREQPTEDEKMRMIDTGVKGDRQPDFGYTL